MMPGSACANPPPERSFVSASRSIRFILTPRILTRLRNDEAQAPLYPLTALLSNVPMLTMDTVGLWLVASYHGQD